MEKTMIEANMTVTEEFSRGFKIGVGFVSPISCLLIFFLYCGIIHYEKMGHDPLKRDLSNRLVSSIFIALTIHIITYFIINSIAVLFDSVFTTIYVTCYWMRVCSISCCHFSIIEFIIYKFFTVYTKTNIINISDEFWHCFLSQMNVMHSFILSIILVLWKIETLTMIHLFSGTLVLFKMNSQYYPLQSL